MCNSSNVSAYIQHDLLWMKLSSQQLSRTFPLNCCAAIKNENISFFLKTTLFMESNLLECAWERRMESDIFRLPYWSIRSSLDHHALCYLQGSTKGFFCLSAEGTQLEACCGPLPQRDVLRDWPLFQSRTETNRLGLPLPLYSVVICIYNFVTFTHFRSITWLLPLIFTGSSFAKNLWLTAWSRVNMQQNGGLMTVFYVMIKNPLLVAGNKPV